MAFTVSQVASGSNATTVGNNATQNYTGVSFASLPTAGQFIVVAMFSNQGGNFTVNTCTIGSTSNTALFQLTQSRYVDIFSNIAYGITLYGGYLDTTPTGTGQIKINWTNTTGATAKLSVAAMTFTGTGSASVLGASASQREASPEGLIDSTTYGANGGLYFASYVGDGTVTTVTASSGNLAPFPTGCYVQIVGSSVLNGAYYCVQGNRGTNTFKILSSFSGSATEANTFATVVTPMPEGIASTSQSGNASSFYTNGFVSWPYFNTLQNTYTARQQPWIAAVYSNSTSVGSHQRCVGVATIDTSGNITTTGQATGTCVFGAVPTTPTSGKGVIYTTQGNMVFSYTGSNGTNTLTGCSISTPPASSINIPTLSYVYLPNAAGQNLAAVLPTQSNTSSVVGGLTTGATAGGGGTVPPFSGVALGSGGAVTGSLQLFGGGNAVGSYATPVTIALGVNGGGAPAGCVGVIMSLVPATRTLTRGNNAVVAYIGKVVKNFAKKPIIAAGISAARVSKTYGRMIRATQIVIARATRTKQYTRTAKATQVLIAQSSRVAQYVRTSLAAQVFVATSTRIIAYARTARATQISVSKLSTTLNKAIYALLRLTVNAKSAANAKGAANAALGVTYALTSTAQAKAQLSASLRETLSMRGKLVANPTKGCAHVDIAPLNDATASISAMSYATPLISVKTSASNSIEQC